MATLQELRGAVLSAEVTSARHRKNIDRCSTLGVLTSLPKVREVVSKHQVIFPKISVQLDLVTPVATGGGSKCSLILEQKLYEQLLCQMYNPRAIGLSVLMDPNKAMLF